MPEIPCFRCTRLTSRPASPERPLTPHYSLTRMRLTEQRGRDARPHQTPRRSRQLGVHHRCRHGRSTALPELRQALLDGAQAQDRLSQVWRGTARDRGAPPQDPGRLCHPQGVRGGHEQGADGGRGAHLRGAQSHHRQGVPPQGVAAGDQRDDPTDHLCQLHDARRGAHPPESRSDPSWPGPIWGRTPCSTSPFAASG